MRKFRPAVFASIAALAVVGTAVAASHDNHAMKLDLPDGSIARIEYRGDVAPKVTVAPALNLASGVTQRSPAISRFSGWPFR